MKKDLKSLAFLFLCFALGVGIMQALIYLHHPSATTTSNPSSTGLGDAPPLRGFFLQNPSPPTTLDALLSLHVTAIAIQYPNNSSALTATIDHAHALGFKVILLPPKKLSEKNPFPHSLPDIASEAQAAHADILCISWLDSDPDPDYWQPLIAQMRKNFSGKLLLAATPDVLPGIEFFNTVDLIGALGPFQLPIRTPTIAHPLTLQDLRTAWACSLDSIESLAHRYGKRAILFDLPSPTPPALSAQANFIPLEYEALLTETKGRNATEGLFLGFNNPVVPADPMLVHNYPDLLTRMANLWSPNAAPRPPTLPTPDTEPDDTEP